MPPAGVRLRQAVLAADDLEATVAALRAAHGLGAPYADPEVALFGLRNAVMAVGDCFLEVVSPLEPGPGTAAGRHLARQGAAVAGYMAIFQVDDLEAARRRAHDLGVRVAWELDLDDIRTTHLHPADTGGAIVSLDRPDPPASWRWAGPAWTGTAGPPGPGRLEDLVVEVPDPAATAARWAAVLGLSDPAPEGRLQLDGDGSVVFREGDAGLCEIGLGGARLDVRALD